MLAGARTCLCTRSAGPGCLSTGACHRDVVTSTRTTEAVLGAHKGSADAQRSAYSLLMLSFMF